MDLYVGPFARRRHRHLDRVKPTGRPSFLTLHAFHRLREDLRRVEERFVGSGTDDANSARLLAGPLADSRCSRLHTFPRAKKHSCRRVNFEGPLVSLTKFLYLRVKPVLPVFVCRMGWPRVS